MSEDRTDDKIIPLHGHQDDALEALYRQADRPQPPARLDAAIRQAARTKPAPRIHTGYPWIAGLVVSVLAGVLLYQLYPVSLPHPPAPAGRQVSPSSPDAYRAGPRPEGMAPDDKAGHAAAASESAAPAAAAAPPKPRFDRMLKERRMAPATAPAAAQPAASSTPPAPGSAGESSAGARPSREPMGQTTAPEHTPEQALATIVGLLNQGNTGAARSAWLTFRRRYPGYDLARHVPADTVRRLEALAP